MSSSVSLAVDSLERICYLARSICRDFVAMLLFPREFLFQLRKCRLGVIYGIL